MSFLFPVGSKLEHKFFTQDVEVISHLNGAYYGSQDDYYMVLTSNKNLLLLTKQSAHSDYMVKKPSISSFTPKFKVGDILFCNSTNKIVKVLDLKTDSVNSIYEYTLSEQSVNGFWGPTFTEAMAIVDWSYQLHNLPTGATTGCNHEWGDYVGIVDCYEYCKKCGIKK